MASIKVLRKLSAQLDLTLQGRDVHLAAIHIVCLDLTWELVELSDQEGPAAAKEHHLLPVHWL